MNQLPTGKGRPDPFVAPFKIDGNEVIMGGGITYTAKPRRFPTVKFIFAWYDLWIGFFWDRSNRKLYFLPLPCIGIVIDFHRPWVNGVYTVTEVGADGVPYVLTRTVEEEKIKGVLPI